MLAPAGNTAHANIDTFSGRMVSKRNHDTDRNNDYFYEEESKHASDLRCSAGPISGCGIRHGFLQTRKRAAYRSDPLNSRIA